jgi:hypothetical protein
MKNLLFSIYLMGASALPTLAFAFIAPNVSQTPGLLCTPQDPNYQKLDYAESIARCQRNVGLDEKIKIATAYGNIPQSEWPNYEFDHLIPLCAGGSDDITNLWPQPIAEAHKKDVLENDICLSMRAGTLKQAEAILKVHNWFNSLALSQNFEATYSTEVNCKNIDSTITVHFFIMGLKQISTITVNQNAKDGEHEVISVKKLVTGKEVSRARSVLLKEYIRYNLNEGSEDHFELFLPSKFTDESAKFTSYLKIGFEDTYPNLTKLECE